MYMARKARKIGARVVSITAKKSSALARQAHLPIIIPAPIGRSPGKQHSRQPGRSVFEQVLFLYLDSVVLKLMSELKIPGEKIEKRHANLE
jgi:D-arabinose 5-phosphate isomerase GutQ